MRVSNYETLVRKVISKFGIMGANMSLKHLERFEENSRAFSDEHGEKFHQEMASTGTRLKGKAVTCSLAEYCWFLC